MSTRWVPLAKEESSRYTKGNRPVGEGAGLFGFQRGAQHLLVVARDDVAVGVGRVGPVDVGIFKYVRTAL